MSEPLDWLIGRVFATPAGADLLARMDEPLTASAIREAIARERKRWSTGGPVQTLTRGGRDD
jgi:hypothetical protein